MLVEVVGRIHFLADCPLEILFSSVKPLSCPYHMGNSVFNTSSKELPAHLIPFVL
jgi:hypothetical protein